MMKSISTSISKAIEAFTKDWKTNTACAIGVMVTMVLAFPNQFGGKDSDLVKGASALATGGISIVLLRARDPEKHE